MAVSQPPNLIRSDRPATRRFLISHKIYNSSSYSASLSARKPATFRFRPPGGRCRNQKPVILADAHTSAVLIALMQREIRARRAQSACPPARCLIAVPRWALGARPSRPRFPRPWGRSRRRATRAIMLDMAPRALPSGKQAPQYAGAWCFGGMRDFILGRLLTAW